MHHCGNTRSLHLPPSYGKHTVLSAIASLVVELHHCSHLYLILSGQASTEPFCPRGQLSSIIYQSIVLQWSLLQGCIITPAYFTCAFSLVSIVSHTRRPSWSLQLHQSISDQTTVSFIMVCTSTAYISMSRKRIGGILNLLRGAWKALFLSKFLVLFTKVTRRCFASSGRLGCKASL